MKHLHTALAAALLLSAFAGGAEAAGANLFSDLTTGKVGARSARDSSLLQSMQSQPTVAQQARKAVSTKLSAQTRELNLNLLPGLNIATRLQSAKTTADGSLVWIGKPELNNLLTDAQGAAGDSAILVQRNGLITGNVRVGGELYSIRPLTNGEHVITRVDESRFPPDHPASYDALFRRSLDRQVSQAVAAAPGNAVAAAANTTIRVLVAYTQGVAAKHADMTSFINLAMAETNQGYANSGIAITSELALATQVTYSETGDFDTDLARFRTKNDGYMDNVHSLRDSNAADLNVLLVTDDAYCGLASDIGSTEATAFAAVSDECATGYYSFAHEMGHLQSARHDPSNDPTNTPYAYGHGYQAPNKAWRTVMAYNCSPSCSRINYWSSPLKTYSDGQVMGTSNKNDNARVLNATAATVAAYRGGSTPPPTGVTYTNDADYAIPDNNTTGVESPITSTRTGQSGTVSVAVNIVHPYIGDLIVDLVAPSGTVYNLQNRSGGSADNIVKTFAVNAGTTASNGVWKLRVRDRANADTGYINSWSITFP